MPCALVMIGVRPDGKKELIAIANVLDKLPKRLHTKAKAGLHEIMCAETRKAARRTIA